MLPLSKRERWDGLKNPLYIPPRLEEISATQLFSCQSENGRNKIII
jgi:hypothetical protein